MGPKTPKSFKILNYVFEHFLNIWPSVRRRAKNAAHIDGSVAKKCKLERQRKKKNILHYFKTRDDEIPQPYQPLPYAALCASRRTPCPALRRTPALPSWIWRAYMLRSSRLIARLYLRSQNTFTSRIHLGSLTQVDLASDFYSSLSSFMVWPRPDVA